MTKTCITSWYFNCVYKLVSILCQKCFLNWPVECDGTETEQSDRAEKFMEELDGLAEQQRVKPPAAAGAGSERHVEGDAHQAGADARARQVLDEAVCHRFKDIRAAGAPQHRGISCGEEGREAEL